MKRWINKIRKGSGSNLVIVVVPPLVGGYSPLRSSKIFLCVSLEAEPGQYPKAAAPFPGCSSLVSASPPFPD